VDIADVDIGDNVGAKLQAEQAEADKVVAQAKRNTSRGAVAAAGNEGADAGDARKVVEERLRCPLPCRGLPKRQSWRDGLPQDEEHSIRHRHARVDRRNGKANARKLSAVV
jgi:hypothetical protein